MFRAALCAFAAVTSIEGIKVGDRLPDVDLDDGFPPEPFSLSKFCPGKKFVLVGLPGAFTPT